MPAWDNGTPPALRAGLARASRFDSWRGRFDFADEIIKKIYKSLFI